MRLIDIERRLARIETTRRGGAPTAILSDRPEGEGPEIRLSDWQSWVADGIGRVHQGVLCITGSEITPDEWAARYVTEH